MHNCRFQVADDCAQPPAAGGPGGRRWRGGAPYSHDGGDGGDEGHDPALKRALEESKMEAIAAEYNHLLASQLDSQRQYYEVRGGAQRL